MQRSVTPPTVADGARPITRLLGALDFADNDVVANEIALNWDPFLDMGGLYDDLRLVSQSIDFDTKNPEDGSGAAGACRRTNGGYYMTAGCPANFAGIRISAARTCAPPCGMAIGSMPEQMSASSTRSRGSRLSNWWLQVGSAPANTGD